MTRDRRDPDGRIPSVIAVLAAAGVVTGWWIRGDLTVLVVPTTSAAGPATPGGGVTLTLPSAGSTPAATGGGAGTSPAADEAAIAALRQRGLRLPIDDADVEELKGM